jgi:acyl-CoA thioester hydrolase
MKSVYEHRVRYRECDPMGVVYHSHYADYFEAARTEALRDLGLAYKDLEATGIILPVVNLNINYHRPCFYDDLLEITTHFTNVNRMKVVMDYEVRVKGEELVRVRGNVTLVFVDAERRRPTAAPQMILDLFQGKEG